MPAVRQFILAQQADHAANTLIYYDGDCTICQFYMRHLRLVNTVGNVATINLRDTPHTNNTLRTLGYEPNKGMIFVYQNTLFYGSDATHAMALLSSKSNWFNALTARTLKYRWSSRMLYPVFKLLRRCMLVLRGKSLIK